VPLVDPETGLISRAWYLFLLSLNNVANAVVDDPVVSPSAESLIASYDALLQALTQELQTQPIQESALDQIAELQKQIEGLEKQIECPCTELTAELQKQIQALEVQPVADIAAISAAINSLSSAPVTKTADFTVAASETWLINNKSGSSCVVTLPTASTNTGRVLYFQNYQNQTLVSASSNVVPLAGGSAGTAILQAMAGATATLVSNGTNWIIMQYSSNNALQLE
jgi:hypothetical protein